MYYKRGFLSLVKDFSSANHLKSSKSRSKKNESSSYELENLKIKKIKNKIYFLPV